MIGSPPLPTSPSTGELADWAELVALERGRIARGKLSTELARSGGSDLQVADAWTELEERAALSGDQWPFVLSSNALERRFAPSDDDLLPAFFAALGLRENIELAHRELFEQCVTELILAVLPFSARLGHQRRPPVPSSFREAFAEYAQRIDERVIQEPPSSDNDLKMDVVAWRPFSDRRGGYFNLVGQCATGADWDEKLDELNLDVIADHLKWAVTPLRFFATPHVVPLQKMRRFSVRGGIILDRPRLLELARAASLSAPTKAEVATVLDGLY